MGISSKELRRELKPVLDRYPPDYHKPLGKLIFRLRDEGCYDAELQAEIKRLRNELEAAEQLLNERPEKIVTDPDAAKHVAELQRQLIEAKESQKRALADLSAEKGLQLAEYDKRACEKMQELVNNNELLEQRICELLAMALFGIALNCDFVDCPLTEKQKSTVAGVIVLAAKTLTPRMDRLLERMADKFECELACSPDINPNNVFSALTIIQEMGELFEGIANG